MSAVIRFRPLIGGRDETPLCYLLEIDEFKILLDCGWEDSFDLKLLDNLKEIAPTIDAVLISYGDLPHIGALPYAVGKLGLKAPIYGTIPAFTMGQMMMYDVILSRLEFEEFDLFTLDDVDATFDNFHQLKYSQKLKLPNSKIEVVPQCAGHMIGGAVWRIIHETDEIVYAVDFNHRQERHLRSIVPNEDLPQSPSLLITDAKNGSTTHSLKKEDRDEDFLEKVLATLKIGGNVLIPSDSAGRVLEILLVLEQRWGAQHLSCYGAALLTKTAFNTCKFASSQLEWMNDRVIKTFDMGRENIFSLKYVKLCHSLEELASLPSPKVVVCSSPTLEYGFSRHLFAEWCSNPLNRILLTDRTTESNTLAHKILERSTSVVNYHLPIDLAYREKLVGRELEEYKKKREAELQAQREKELEELRKKEEQEAQEEEEEEDPFDEKANPYFTTSYDLFSKDVKEGDPFPMFPYGEAPVEWDEYGEVLPEGYLQLDSKDSNRSWGLEEGMSRRAEKLKEQEKKDKSKHLDSNALALAIEQEVPTKCIVKSKTLAIRCSVVFVNYEGRSDGTSKKRILSQIAPRKLILVHGSESDIQHITDVASTLRLQAIYTPETNTTINLEADTAIHRLLVQESLWKSLKFIRVDSYELAYVRGMVKGPKRRRIEKGEDVVMEDGEKEEGEEEEEGEEGEDDEEGEKRKKFPKMEDLLPSLAKSEEAEGTRDGESEWGATEEWEPDPIALNNLRKRKSQHNPILIGEVKLPDLRKAADERGLRPKLARGVLRCKGIKLYKPSEGGGGGGGGGGGQKRWEVEGPVCDEFYAVRELLLKKYQMV